MRKFALLAAAGGLALAGSFARADFTITDTRVASSVSGYDTVTLFITNDGTNGTGGGASFDANSTTQIDFAAYDTSGNGIRISSQNLHSGKFVDVYSAGAESSLPTTSWMVPVSSWSSLFGSASNTAGAVLNKVGSTYVVDQASGTTFTNTYTDGQNVGGISGDEFWSSGDSGALSATKFAQITILSTDNLVIAAPGTGTTATGRPGITTNGNWETAATAFGIPGGALTPADGSPMTIPATVVPEPASIACVGLGFAGLLLRRRRHA
jgi:hypothetical protein